MRGLAESGTGAERGHGALDSARKTVEMYLRPPYRFDVPRKDLMPGDPDYDNFLCRSSNTAGLLFQLNAAINGGEAAPELRGRLRDEMATLVGIINQPGRRSDSDMERMHASLENLSHILSQN